MQFQYNSDYPDRFYQNTTNSSSNSSSNGNGSPPPATKTNHHHLDAREPFHFPPVQPISCTRITTRIYNPVTQTIVTVPNVLVKNNQHQQRRVSKHAKPPQRLSVQSFDLNQFQMNVQDLDGNNDDDEHMESSDDDFSTDDEGTLKNDETTDALLFLEHNDTHHHHDDPDHMAYWIQNIIREAIYGRVYKAIVLKKIHPQQKQQILQSVSAADPTLPQQQQQQMIQNVEWEITNYDCAVKEMSWQHIRKERDRLAEDPVKEVCAMQFFKNWYNHSTTTTTTDDSNLFTTTSQQQTIPILQQQQQTTTTNNTTTSRRPNQHTITTSFRQMLDTNVMMPLDLLSDEKYLYSIMPYCNGGELFELLNMNDRFTEDEARYWMYQVLNGIESLQHAGICHRDMSLENLLVHESGALIIDMGMCLRIPYEINDDTLASPPTPNLSSSFHNMSIDHPTNTRMANTFAPTNMNDTDPNYATNVSSVRNLRRYMIKPQGTCGKWHYMSPEIHNNNTPFDGYTVDMWAAGVILFLMLTGFPPWDRPSTTDERFKYMSAGYLVQMLTEWEIGLSPDAMDLLQRMMFLDPKDRLSLDQVRAHPWMVNGPRQPPTN